MPGNYLPNVVRHFEERICRAFRAVPWDSKQRRTQNGGDGSRYYTYNNGEKKKKKKREKEGEKKRERYKKISKTQTYKTVDLKGEQWQKHYMVSGSPCPLISFLEVSRLDFLKVL